MARILIAEDEPDVRTYCARAVEAFGHQAVAVTDGAEALERLYADRFDLLLTDIVMPQMDGIALALKASKEWPRMPILMMTGYAAQKQRAHNLDSLIHDVLTKPFSLDELKAAVEAALARSA